MLFNRKISVIALPAHASDQQQPLNISVFRPMKTYARNAVRGITLRQVRQHPNKVYISGLDVWESMITAYKKSVTTQNVFSGFRSSELWLLDVKAACKSVLRASLSDDTLVFATCVARIVHWK